MTDLPILVAFDPPITGEGVTATHAVLYDAAAAPDWDDEDEEY